MRKFLLLLISISVLLIGCSITEKKGQQSGDSNTELSLSPLQEELLLYINEQLKPIGPYEERALSRLREVTGENFTNATTFKRALESEIIPNYEQVVVGLKRIQPQTEELRKLHEAYLKGAEKQLNSMNLAYEALVEQSQSKTDKSNQLMIEGMSMVDEYKQGMKQLAEKHNIDYTMPGM